MLIKKGANYVHATSTLLKCIIILLGKRWRNLIKLVIINQYLLWSSPSTFHKYKACYVLNQHIQYLLWSSSSTHEYKNLLCTELTHFPQKEELLVAGLSTKVKNSPCGTRILCLSFSRNLAQAHAAPLLAPVHRSRILLWYPRIIVNFNSKNNVTPAKKKEK